MIVFAIFIIIPLTELAVFYEIGDEIGLLNTLILCALTAIIGYFFVRRQGLETLIKGQKALHAGELPMDALFDGFCIVIAGALLMTPGFVTDTIGFLLLTPPVRDVLLKYLASRTRFQSAAGEYRAHKPEDTHIIEGDFEHVPPENDNDHNNQKG